MRTVKDHDARKDEILDTAERFFLSQGYEKTTINDILKSIGIAKGTFYHYFKSKEEVMDAIIMRIVAADVILAKEILAEKQLSALDRIFKFLFAQSADSNEQKGEMLEQFPKVENALMKQRAMEATLKHVCPVLKEIIAEGNRSKEFDTPYPLEAIQFLIAGIQAMMDEGMKASEEEMNHRYQAFIDITIRVLGIAGDEKSRQEVFASFTRLFAN